MTREEAITTLQRFQFGPNPVSAHDLEALNRSCSTNLVDAFVALGMLTLDHPTRKPNHVATLVKRLEKRVSYPAPPLWLIENVLRESGLKIVEA